MDGRVRRPPIKPTVGYMEGAPVTVCRPWRFGDERRGLRGVPCMVNRCPHVVAVTRDRYQLGAGYICIADAESYGLLPAGTARHEADEAGRDLA